MGITFLGGAQIALHQAQQLHQLALLFGAEACHGLACKLLALASGLAMQGLRRLGQIDPGYAAVFLISAGLQQALVFHARNQARQLPLVPPAVRCQIALGSTRMAREKSQHLALHMAHRMGAVFVCPQMLRAHLVHHGMHELQHVVFGWRR